MGAVAARNGSLKCSSQNQVYDSFVCQSQLGSSLLSDISALGLAALFEDIDGLNGLVIAGLGSLQCAHLRSQALYLSHEAVELPLEALLLGA